jgi:hypothetical protein
MNPVPEVWHDGTTMALMPHLAHHVINPPESVIVSHR